MQHHLSFSLVALIAASSVTAQCFESNFGTLCPRGANPAGFGDDVLFDVLPLNFAFPMGGISGTYTHVEVQSNGVVFLSNGAPTGQTNTGYSGTSATQIANLRGAAGSPPRLAPFWRDLDNRPENGGGVFFNDLQPGRFVVTWANTVQFNTVAPVFTVQLQMFATGEVSFYYSETTASSAPVIVGLSEGNATPTVPGVDLSAGGNSSFGKLLYQRFASGAFDLAAQCMRFAPNAVGGFDQSVLLPASNVSYGQGCYDIATESFYQFLPNATLAAAALNGQSLVMTPAAQGYTAAWGGGTYVAPSGAATPLAVGDDLEVGVTPSIALPTPFGPAPDLRVNGNGVVSLGSSPQSFPGAPEIYIPTPAALVNAPLTAFWAWHDYNSNEPGSGPVSYEEVTLGGNTVALITWDGVENYSQPAGPNPSTMQFQLDLTTGVVTIVWQSVDANPTSAFGSSHLVGFSTGGASLNPGSISLANALPLTTQPDVAAISLSASPRPLSTSTGGTLIFETSNIPEMAPGSGMRTAAHVLSVGGIPEPGVDLGFLGAPGCRAYVLTLDVVQLMLGSNSTQTVSVAIPPNAPLGFEVFGQSLALVNPNSLPNGQNAYGAVTSNGVRSYISSY